VLHAGLSGERARFYHCFDSLGELKSLLPKEGAMKRLAILVISFLIILLVICTIACAGEEKTPTPTAVPTLTPGDIESTIEAFNRMPLEWGRARYINLAAFRADSNLRAFYEECYRAVGNDLAGIGIDLNEIDSVSFFVQQAAIYSGQLDFDHIKEALRSMNYVRSTYLDIEIWESPESGGGFIALLSPDSVLVTLERQDAELCISVVKKWGDPIYSDSDVQDVMSRLPTRLLRVDIEKDGASSLLATGSSVEKIDSSTLKMTTIAKFQDDASAEKGFSDIENQFHSWANSWNMMNVENAQIRRFVKSTGYAEIQDTVNLLGTYETYWLH
jgi:hypothetical protein